MNEDEYKCVCCGEVWGWCPEDYEDPSVHEDICPFCTMPFSQLIGDIYKTEGVRGTASILRIIYKRIKYGTKQTTTK